MPEFDNPQEVDLDAPTNSFDIRRLLFRIANDPVLIEIGRKAIEDEAIEMRDMRASIFGVGNGIVVNEADGSSSSTIRLWTPDAIIVALRAIANASRHEITWHRELYRQQRESREQ